MRVLFTLILLKISLPLFSQANLPFFYGGTWGSTSMSSGNLTSNNAETYNTGDEHRLDETNHFIQLSFNPVSSGTFDVKLISKTGGGAWSGTVLLQQSANGTTWSTLQTITTIGNNNISISPSVTLSSNTAYVRVFYSSRISGSNLGVDDFSVSGVLPVTFSKYTTNAYKNLSILSFSTASETNNDYFTIERSGDGRNFDAIGEIKGADNSTEEKHYEFIDENPLSGINYYRIKQTDYDGQYSYSEIRSVRHTGKGNVAISPRSTDGRLDISTEMENYDVAVYSSAGQEVARFAALAGHQTVSIEALQAGVYFVKVMSGAESETVRVVKY